MLTPAQALTPSAEPVVTIDEVAPAAAPSRSGEIFERVHVSRMTAPTGPQDTLFGRNAAGERNAPPTLRAI